MSPAQIVIADIKTIFVQIDTATSLVAQKSGLSCPTACSRCCDNPAIEALPLEMLPLAARLWGEALSDGVASVEARSLINQVNDPDSTWDICRLFQPSAPGLGHCLRYEERPSLCRLFGYSAWVNEYNRPQFSACFHHGAIQPAEVKRATLLAMAGGGFAVHEEIDEKLLALGEAHKLSTALQERRPINEALRMALAWIHSLIDTSA